MDGKTIPLKYEIEERVEKILKKIKHSRKRQKEKKLENKMQKEKESDHLWTSRENNPRFKNYNGTHSSPYNP